MATSLKKIDSNIAVVKKMGVEYNDLIHDTAVMILEHAAEHGDCSRSQTLVMALPASMRRTMLIAWFTEFSPIVVKNNDDWAARMHKPETVTGKTNPLYKPFNIEAAKELPFWKMAQQNRERDFKPLEFADIVKMVEDLANKIERQLEEGKVTDDDVPSAIAIVDTLEGLHFTRIKKEAEEASANDAGETADEEKERAAA